MDQLAVICLMLVSLATTCYTCCHVQQSFQVWVFNQIYYGTLPELDTHDLRGDTWGTNADAEHLLHILLGWAVFAVVFKGLKVLVRLHRIALHMWHVAVLHDLHEMRLA